MHSIFFRLRHVWLKCFRLLNPPVNNCLDFFEKQRENHSDIGPELRAKSVTEIIEWESFTASTHSRHGVVDNSEDVYRQLLDPVHWNRLKGEFTPNAFNDADSFGLSVNRIKYTTPEILASAATARVEAWNKENIDNAKPKREFLGFAKLSCEALRSGVFADDKGGKERVFAVFDTALLEDESHADVFRLSSIREKEQKKVAKRILWDLAMANLLSPIGQPIDATQMGEHIKV